MIRREGKRLVIEGAVTLATHVALRERADALFDADAVTIDWAEVETVDSSALALILHWRRHAVTQRSQVSQTHLPAGVIALAKLYGVSELLEAV